MAKIKNPKHVLNLDIRILNLFRISKGFTLIELLVVTAIIALMTALILPNYRSGDRQLAFQRSAYKLTQDLRRAEELALSSQKFGDKMPKGYGIYFDISDPDHYILFADVDGNQQYDSSSEKVEEISLEKQIQLAGLEPISGNSLTIVFVPPDPTITIYPDASLASITLGIIGTSPYTYKNFGSGNGWDFPRAECDISDQIRDCPDSFPASAQDFSIVYDQYYGESYGDRSKWYVKSESQTQKTVQVNKAGLIAVE